MAGKRLLAAGALATGAALGAVEARYRRHPGNDISVVDEAWRTDRLEAGRLRFGGTVVVHNEIATREVMLVDVVPRVTLLSQASVKALTVGCEVRSLRKDYPPRADGYWTAYVVKPGRYGEDSPFELELEVTGPSEDLDALSAVWIEVKLVTYGFEGWRDRYHHIVVPLAFPDPADSPPWRDSGTAPAQVKAVRTHLLCPFDDPVEVVRRYALPHAEPTDIITIGESPLAVIQRRFHDPRNLPRTYAATRLAQFMHGEGALGTAGGMQALMQDTGPWRVLGALVGGALGKAAGQAGWFYRLVGPQGRLVDDVTGTLAPYDNFTVVGPLAADEVCRAITAGTGLRAAVVDANDLGKVDIVGASDGVPHELVCDALRSNPAGNADETTPLVLIRPT
ncbi:MAG: F420-0:Gamma-glutamyl ligase [Acidimicrobiales bacterium]|nr:F420-0:Gamma-glutamyl ligase [Acidimicrobiales bacterium]